LENLVLGYDSVLTDNFYWPNLNTDSTILPNTGDKSPVTVVSYPRSQQHSSIKPWKTQTTQNKVVPMHTLKAYGEMEV